jgi:hypothetical protein
MDTQDVAIESAELTLEDLEAVASAALCDENGDPSLHGVINGSF